MPWQARSISAWSMLSMSSAQVIGADHACSRPTPEPLLILLALVIAFSRRFQPMPVGPLPDVISHSAKPASMYA
jgi:hypothetical protein